uniref:Golgin subfamily A conserved domain-containing protein n=1 Tax=Chlorocebus sabaeus TaxID=60711 RepID=A0A0D9RXL1_CHLSB
MWPQPRLPPHPAMSEKTRQDKLAAAKKKLKEYQQRNSPGVPAGAKTKKTGSSPETTTSGGCHSPEDSRYQELAVALDSNSATINHLNENIESLKQQKKQVEHQLEEEKKANNEIHKAQMEQLETINILMLEKADLKTTLYHTKRAARHFEEESKDLASRLQYSLQRTQELEWALSAVSTQQQEEDRSSSHSEAVLQQQLQQSTKERALLMQVTESLKQVQLERDEYAQHITGERARWQERMWKMSVEACTLKEEKHDIHRIQELERSLSEFKPQMAEPLSPAPPAGTSEVKQLQDEAKHLRKEVESLEGKLQSQVENNQALSLLSKEQKESFRDQEERVREQEEQKLQEQERLCAKKERLQKQQERLREQGERLRKQEKRLRKEKERLRKEEEERLWDQEERPWDQEERPWNQEERLRKQEERLALSQNHTLDKQLAEPQCSFEDLNNENKSALQLEQQVKELQEKLGEECLEAASQQNQQLETQLSVMALPGEGDGGGHLDSEEEEAPRPMPSIPQDLENQEAMSGFMDLPKEKADGKEQVEKLELGFIQLSEATDGMREYITVYEIQGAVPNTWHQDMEDVIRLAQNEEEMKVNMLELPKLVLPLVGDHEGHGKFFATPQNPADEPAPGAPAPEELGAAGKQGDFCEVSLDNSVEPTPGEARKGSPHDNPTAEQIMYLLPVMQDT